MDTIRIRGLSKRYPRTTDLFQLLRHPVRRQETTALCGVDLELCPGEIYGLVGPNGAGKTTFLKILAGLVLPTDGQVRWGAEDLAARRARGREGIGLVVSDERSFFWRISVRENLRFFATLQRIPRAERDARIDECLDLVGLRDRRDDAFHSLSTGLRQRLAIARGLLGDPQVLLMDEATRSLDPRAAAEVLAVLRELFAGQPGRLLVYASHDLDEVRTLCTQVVVLEHGVVTSQRQVLRPAEVTAYRVRTRAPLPGELLARLPSVQRDGADALYTVRVDRGAEFDAVVDALRAAGAGILSVEPLQLGADDLFEPAEPIEERE